MKKTILAVTAVAFLATPLTALAQGGGNTPAGSTKEQKTGAETKNAPSNPSSSTNPTTMDSSKDKMKKDEKK